MSGLDIDPWLHKWIQPSLNCRNGQLVSAIYQSQLAALANQITRLRPKEMASFGGYVDPAINSTWRWASHTSPLVGSIVARMVIAKAPQYVDPDTLVGPLVPSPSYLLSILNSSGTEIGGGSITAGYANGETPSGVPDEWTVQTIVVDARDFQDTSIRGELLSFGGGRVLGATIYEYAQPPDTLNGYINQTYSIGQGIYDTDRSDVAVMARNQWKRGAAHLANFTSARDATAPTNSSATYRNVWDATDGTARFAGTPSWYVDLRYCNRKSSTTVPCRFETFAGYGGAGSGTVRIVDAAGTVLASCAISGAPAWYQTTANLAPSNAPVYLEHASDGANTMTTYAASLYQYNA